MDSFICTTDMDSSDSLKPPLTPVHHILFNYSFMTDIDSNDCDLAYPSSSLLDNTPECIQHYESLVRSFA